MNYAYLTGEHQATMLRERLAAIEGEHYQHEPKRPAALELQSGANGSQLEEAKQMIASAEHAQSTLEAAHRVVQAALEQVASGEGSTG